MLVAGRVPYSSSRLAGHIIWDDENGLLCLQQILALNESHDLWLIDKTATTSHHCGTCHLTKIFRWCHAVPTSINIETYFSSTNLSRIIPKSISMVPPWKFNSSPLKISWAPKEKDHLPVPSFFRGKLAVKLRGVYYIMYHVSWLKYLCFTMIYHVSFVL